MLVVCGASCGARGRMDLDESVPQDEKLRLSHLIHRLGCDEGLAGDKAAIKAEIVSAVEEHGECLGCERAFGTLGGRGARGERGRSEANGGRGACCFI